VLCDKNASILSRLGNKLFLSCPKAFASYVICLLSGFSIPRILKMPPLADYGLKRLIHELPPKLMTGADESAPVICVSAFLNVKEA
jgi:hypothetical protein